MCVIAYVLGVTTADSPGLSWSQPVWRGRNVETTRGCCCWDNISSCQTQPLQPVHVILYQTALKTTKYNKFNFKLSTEKNISQQRTQGIYFPTVELSLNSDASGRLHGAVGCGGWGLCYCPNFRSSYAKYSESPGPVLDHKCGALSLGCHVLCVSFITCLIEA